MKTNDTLPETNIAPKNGWLNTTFLLGRTIFRGELLVSGRVALIDIKVYSFSFPHTRCRNIAVRRVVTTSPLNIIKSYAATSLRNQRTTQKFRVKTLHISN